MRYIITLAVESENDPRTDWVFEETLVVDQYEVLNIEVSAP